LVGHIIDRAGLYTCNLTIFDFEATFYETVEDGSSDAKCGDADFRLVAQDEAVRSDLARLRQIETF
jgi:hypothetical protein